MAEQNSIETLAEGANSLGKLILALPGFFPFILAGAGGYQAGRNLGWHPMFSILLGSACFAAAIGVMGVIHWALLKIAGKWAAATFTALWSAPCYALIVYIVSGQDPVWTGGALVLAFAIIVGTEKKRLDELSRVVL